VPSGAAAMGMALSMRTAAMVAAVELGFSPIQLGGLSEGGLLVQARGHTWGQLIFKDLVKFD
jgi:phage FluMu protein gp41